MQEFKFMLVLGVTMYGLCQYNKTELAWIFLIFPIIYVLIKNSLLYIHVSSALQNAPRAEAPDQTAQYGMQPPLLQQKEKSASNTGGAEQYILPKVSNNSVQLGGSPMFNGRIKSVGPRYCPSIEDKINRFSERERHQLFVEPEGWNTVEV